MARLSADPTRERFDVFLATPLAGQPDPASSASGLDERFSKCPAADTVASRVPQYLTGFFVTAPTEAVLPY